MRLAIVVLFAISIVCPGGLWAQTFNERMQDWPVETTIKGTIIACNNRQIGNSHAEMLWNAAGRNSGKILLIGDIDSSVTWPKDARVEQLSWKRFVEEWHDKESSFADQMGNATGVWLASPDKSGRQDRKALESIRPQLKKILFGRGALMTSGFATSVLGKYQIRGGKFLGDVNQASIAPGLDLIPDVILQTRYATDANRRQLISALGSHPRCVGIGMDSGVTLVLRGRKIRAMTVIGDSDDQNNGQLHFVTMANDRKPMRTKSIGSLTSRRANPYEFLVDLTAWRRDAIDRTQTVFPPAQPAKPFVKNGTLIIIGGGGMPNGLMDKFIELAGGKNARLLYVPCLEREQISARDQRLVAGWKQRGVASATVFHTKDRNQANSDDEFLQPLKTATGIFFGGGRQWNFSDSYYGTQAHRLMKEVLERGGVIAGSSAGASIQGRYLARANPLGNIDIMADGYEKGGLGFLDGVAIDQHFSQRGRQKDMTSLVNRYPQLLGIGLDESTAIVVQKSIARVEGRGSVFFYDRKTRAANDDPDYLKLGDGAAYDLANRKVVEDE